MSSDPLHDVGAGMEMTTQEAAAYLSGPVGYTISPRVMYGLKSFGLGPIVEKRGSRADKGRPRATPEPWRTTNNRSFLRSCFCGGLHAILCNPLKDPAGMLQGILDI